MKTSYFQLSIFFIFSLIGLDSGKVSAQTPYLADQFLINPFQTNPAVAGIYRVIPVQVTARQQWMGMSAAPSTQAVTMHANMKSKGRTYNQYGFLNKGKHSFGKIGLGGGFFKFSYGDISQVGVHFDYAYHVFVGRGRIAFALAPMYHQFVIDKSQFILPDGDAYDPVIHLDPNETLHFFDANVGVHYYTDNFYAGFSAIQLFNSTAMFGQFSYENADDPNKNPYLARTFYGYAGIILPMGDLFELEPSVVASMNQQNGPGFQINSLFRISQLVEAGISYQFQKSFGVIAGAEIGNVFFRYLFELPMGNQSNTPYNTHQLMVGFNLQQDR